ncbi:MAG: DNA replication/repair protein RecF [Acetobacter sp.]|nr:DNA replication/repair protein RecF [Acetobacter sp.]MBR2124746.1 DNA replication/repair protein RecF [Acetobacter sp.]
MSCLLKLRLSQFRNYSNLLWEPHAELLVLTGDNGSGKTNLLEALSLLAPGRGLRAAPLGQIGQCDSTEWAVFARLKSAGDYLEIGTGVQREAEAHRRVLLCNGKRFRNSQWGHDFSHKMVSVVWVTPQMDRLFSGGLSERRRFLDRLVIAIFPQHASELAAYEKAMTQRNKLLQTRFSERAWISGVEHAMARHAVAIAAARNETVERLNQHTQHARDSFSATRLDVHCPIGASLYRDPALVVEDWFRDQLSTLRAQDCQKGGTSLGVHRADCVLTNLHTGQSAAIASTGQQKALLVGLVLTHAHVVTEYRGIPPLLLLDEPLVHLDEVRRVALLKSLQTFKSTVLLTGTDKDPFSSLKGKAQFMTVHHGNLFPSDR